MPVRGRRMSCAIVRSSAHGGHQDGPPYLGYRNFLLKTARRGHMSSEYKPLAPSVSIQSLSILNRAE